MASGDAAAEKTAPAAAVPAEAVPPEKKAKLSEPGAEVTQTAAEVTEAAAEVTEAAAEVTEAAAEVTQPSPALRVKRLSEKATLPLRGSEGAAGYDLSSAEDTSVPARGKAIVKTDLSIAIPLGTYARIAPRSGLAAKHSIDVGAGVVDYDYRGNVGVILFNFSDKDFSIKVGDRIAQLILERIVTPPVEEVDELDLTERGAGGFGSTGVSVKPAENGQ